MMRVTYQNQPPLPPRPEEKPKRPLPALHGEVTAAFARLEPPKRPPKYSMIKILRIVADFYQVTPEALTGDRRMRSVAHPRQMGMYLAYTLCQSASMPAVARAFGRKDHTTVLHAKRAVEARIAKFGDVRSDYEHLVKIINGDADDETHD